MQDEQLTPEVHREVAPRAAPATGEMLPDRGGQNIALSDLDAAPIDLPTAGPVSQERYEDLHKRFVAISDEKFDLKAKLERETSRVRTAQTLDDLIKPYASKAYLFMVGYSVIAALFLILDGFKIKGFDLPDEVLKLLVGSTAVTVLGLVGMVLTGIFVGARKTGA